MLVSLSQYQLLPTKPGIYLFLNQKGKILYVGKAKNLKKRVSSYFLKNLGLGPKTSSLVSQISKISVFEVSSEIEALLLEANYIKKYKPKYNIRMMDGKAYPLIKITIKDSYPKVLISRHADNDRSIYFGPFPTAGAMRLTLKIIRRIFPYQSVINHSKKICLFYHLGLCPCPPVFDSLDFKKNYNKNIRHIISFLEGKTKKVLADLEKERDILSKNEHFEKAEEIQNKIKAIEIITGPFYKIDLNVNPNLAIDLRNKEMEELKAVLNIHKVNVLELQRIECFDISNTSGTNATGSMVVFTNGEKSASEYRKFRIRILNTPNDFVMMEQVIQRRLNHPEWPYPNLLIVDGGKGQIASALKVLTMKQFNNITIPVIGLAKKEETIITSDLKEISLPKSSDALKLVMRIRDEAHRFALTYHKKLRSKSLLT